LGSENPQVVAARPGLDPARVKSTSRLVEEAAAADAEGGGDGEAAASSSSQGRGGRGAGRGQKRPRDTESPAKSVANSRSDLHNKLEERIAELREERRRKQSEKDKAKAQSNKAAAAGSPGNGKAAGLAKRGAGDEGTNGINADSLEAGRLSFAPRPGQLPFEANVGKKGRKVQRLRSDLRRHEAEAAKLRKAEMSGDKQVRQDLAMRKALMRASGQKVHDDPSKLRKAQKKLEVKRKKGKDKWNERMANEKKQQEDHQAARKENLQKKREGKRKGVDRGRVGFEGKRGGYLNSS